MVKVRDDLPIKSDGSIDLDDWLAKIAVNISEKDHQLLHKAGALSLAKGSNTLTPFGQSCFAQGLVTAQILIPLKPDANTLASAILYFTVRYADLSLDEIRTKLNNEIASLIYGVSQIDATQTKQTNLKQAISEFSQRDKLRKMLLAVVNDVRVVLIKLAERISTLRASAVLDEDLKRNLAIETRDIYAPLANRLGIGQIKWELEDFAFRFLEPVTYKKIAKLLDEKRVDRELYIQQVISQIKEVLNKEQIDSEIFGRAKHIYSIWRKMLKKNIDFKEVYDVRAIRVLVDNLRDCYSVLGIVHALWQYIPKEFDDYIATPKENGYRSLHTAVIGPGGKNIEIQIRTHKMHQEAELGVAAHWLYKEGIKQDQTYQKKLSSLRQILDWQEEISDYEEATNALKSELFEDRVYVFTPNGDVVDLPKNATPLDFAYQVHTDIGHRCRGAKVNGVMVPLNHHLTSGDQIEILTTKEGGPSRDWLNTNLGYLASTRAKAKILLWFKHQDKDNNTEQGKETLERELKRLGLESFGVNKLATKLKYKTPKDLFAAVGSGEIRISQVINVISAVERAEKADQLVVKPSKVHRKSDISIAGIGDLMCHFAKCCKPVPGDPIVGFITLGRGVTVHRQDCMNVLNKNIEVEQRLVQVDWGDSIANDYPVDIKIMAYDRQGLLKDITSILSNSKINVTHVNSFTNKEDNIANLIITLEIHDLNSLGSILTKILQLPNIIEAYRITSKAQI